jgi:hypothetical protein
VLLLFGLPRLALENSILPERAALIFISCATVNSNWNMMLERIVEIMMMTVLRSRMTVKSKSIDKFRKSEMPKAEYATNTSIGTWSPEL